jgi:hypothetical protein
MCETATRKVPKPILIIASSARQMTWQGSIDRCEELMQKHREHGHKLPYKCGDEVIDFEGRVGVLTHKEFLYPETETGPGHDVWQLVVQHKASCKTYSNPSALSLHCVREDVQHEEFRPANLLL